MRKEVDPGIGAYTGMNDPGTGGLYGGGGRPTVTGGGTKNSKQTFLDWAKKLGLPNDVAGDVWYWSKKYNPGENSAQFAYYWAAVLKRESGGHHLNKYGQLTDSGEAGGVGQIAHSWVGQHIPWEPQGVVFTNDSDGRTGLWNYGVNIRMSAYLLSDAVAHYGYNGAYIQGYNPNDPNKQKAWADIQSYLKTLPKGVGPLAPSEGPGQGAGPGTNPEGKGPNTDPFVVGVNKAGKLLLGTDETKAITWDGAPMKRSDWKSLTRSLESYFVSYTGGRPSNKMMLNYINKGWSPYTLTIALSQSKKFDNSPIYKKYAPMYQDAVKNILAPGEKVDNIRDARGKRLIKSAIVNGWGADTFAAVLRQRPQYVQSNEFKGSSAALMNVHASIMGVPDKKSLNVINQAALAGWDANQYAAYLRSQPEYVQSPEYQSKTLSFLSGLGLITGMNPVLKKGVSHDKPQPGGYGPLPNDPRLPKGDLTAPEDTVATYG